MYKLLTLVALFFFAISCVVADVRVTTYKGTDCHGTPNFKHYLPSVRGGQSNTVPFNQEVRSVWMEFSDYKGAWVKALRTGGCGESAKNAVLRDGCHLLGTDFDGCNIKALTYGRN